MISTLNTIHFDYHYKYLNRVFTSQSVDCRLACFAHISIRRSSRFQLNLISDVVNPIICFPLGLRSIRVPPGNGPTSEIESALQT